MIFEQRPDRKKGAKPHGYQGLVLTNSVSEAHACEVGRPTAGTMDNHSEMRNPGGVRKSDPTWPLFHRETFDCHVERRGR